MAGYIGAKVGTVTANAADIKGDISSTDTSPDLTLKNTTQEDTDGGRESTITFKGEQTGGEESTLAEIRASHDGTADDEKGDLIFKTNDGSDGASPTERLRIDSGGVVTITRADNGTQLNLKSTDADGSGGPILDLTRDSASPADGDVLGLVRFKGDDAGGNETTYAQMIGFIEDEAAGAEDGTFKIETLIGGSSQARLDMTSTETVFNEGSIDLDFRVESDGDANAFFVRGSDSKVAINNTDFLSTLHVRDTGANSGSLRVGGSGASLGLEFLYDQSGSTVSTIQANPTYTSDAQLLKIRSDGDRNPNQLVLKGDGNVMIGRASAGSTGNGHTLRGGDSCIFSRDAVGETVQVCRNDSQGDLIQFRRNGSICGEIVNTGSSSVGYNTSSDYRLKENVTDVTDGITRVKQLAPKRFNFIADGTDRIVDGFLAHEAATVVPEAVTGTKDEIHVWNEGDELPEGVSVGDNKLDDDGNTIPKYQGIDQAKLVPLLTAALQEAIAKIETLETKVAALEG